MVIKSLKLILGCYNGGGFNYTWYHSSVAFKVKGVMLNKDYMGKAMKKIKQITTLILCCLFSSFLVAAPGGVSDFTDLSEKRLQVVKDGKDKLYIHGVMMKDSRCEKKNQPLLPLNDELSREMLRMILSAKKYGTKVQLKAGDCVRIAAHTYPVVNEISIQ